MKRIDYLADLLGALGQTRVPPALRAPREVLDFLSSGQDLARLVRGRELFTFTDKALRAASDLRADTPERMERLIAAVTRSPGRLFLEARTSELVGILSNIRGFLDAGLEEGLQDEDRIGFCVDIDAEGVIDFTVLRLLSPEAADVIARQSGLKGIGRDLPESLRTLLGKRLRVVSTGTHAKIDIRRHIGISREEFERVLDRAGAGDPFLDAARQRLATAGGGRERARDRDTLWRMARLRDLVEITQDPRPAGRIEGGMTLMMAQMISDPIRIGLHLIALLALLSAEAREIAFLPRPETEKRDRKTSLSPRVSGGARLPAEPGRLRVVSLNIDLPPSASQGDTARGASAGGGSESGGRARHPVRGHLFLARNGRLVWRKPHWRGSLDETLIHRVTTRN